MSGKVAASGPSCPPTPPDRPEGGAGAGAEAATVSASHAPRGKFVLAAKAGTTFYIGDGVVVGPNGKLYSNIWADPAAETGATPETAAGSDATDRDMVAPDADGDSADSSNSSDTASGESGDEEDSHPNYSKPHYWDNRYSTDDEPFDWLFKWEHFAAAGFTKFIPPASKVLMLGCGNADFSADMYDSGITTNITNIDLSSVVINKMRKANLSRVGMTYHIMDVQDLEFADGCFDVVIDKSTMDCIFCCTDSTDIVCRMLEQAYRVLKPGGTYICMSLHDDEKVLPYLTSHPDIHWTVEWEAIRNPRFQPGSMRSEKHHVFICYKPLPQDDVGHATTVVVNLGL